MRNVFVSRPNVVTQEQEKFLKKLNDVLTERGLAGRTVGQTDYPNTAPVAKVKAVMADCQGSIVVGLKQIHIISGVEKPGTATQKPLANTYLPSAWNHLEAGMAFAYGLPLLIMKESGVVGGVFDIGTTDRFVHQADVTGRNWLKSQQFLQPFNEWVEEVLRFGG